MKRKTSNKQLAQALYEVTEGVKGEQLHKAITEFAKLLVRVHKITRANNIIQEFERYSKKQQGVVEIEVQSVRKLEEKTLNQLKKVFFTKSISTSNEEDGVEISEKVDESLLGGIKVRTEDKILDGSLKTQLNQLKQSLV